MLVYLGTNQKNILVYSSLDFEYKGTIKVDHKVLQILIGNENCFVLLGNSKIYKFDRKSFEDLKPKEKNQDVKPKEIYQDDKLKEKY